MTNKENDSIEQDRHKTRVLWICVSLISIFLAGSWFWAFKNSLLSFNWSETTEQQMMKKIGADWEAANALVTEPLRQKKAAEAEVKNKLMELAEINASSTAPSTTEEVVATTTVEASTTTQ